MPGRYTSARFVGRDEAFARLAAALDDAARGRTRSMLIGGSAGVGVTRLLDEAVERMGSLAHPLTILRADVWPGDDDEPYGPLIRAIGPTLDALDPGELADRLGPATPEVLRILPSLAARLHVGDRAMPRERMATAPERRQGRTMEGILGLLGRLGEQQPVVLILENLHRADAATRALVTFMTRIARTQRLAIIGTHQPDVVLRDDPWAADLATLDATSASIERWALPPLSRHELAALIEGIEGERPSGSLLLLVGERSNGLPLAVEELLAARRELPQESLTGSFDDLVMARIAARSLECRRVLRMISTAGRPLSTVQLAAVAAAFEVGATRPAPRSMGGPRHGDGVLGADLVAGRAEALEYGFIVERDGLIEIRHETIGRAVERDLLPDTRTRYHAACVVALADLPFAATRHALAAQELRAARASAIEAAGIAATRHAPADELAALELALAIPEDRDLNVVRPWAETPIWDQIGLQIRASEAALAVGRTARATAFLEASIGALASAGDRTRLGLMHERLARVRRAAGDAAGGMAAAQRAAELVPHGATPARARVLATLAQLSMLDGLFTDAQRIGRDAVSVARACEPADRVHEIHALTTLGVALAWGSDPDGGIALLREAEVGARAIDDPDALFRAFANLTTVLDLVGRRADAVKVAYRGIDEARSAGLETVYGNFLAGNVAETLIFLGRWDEARDLCWKALSWSPVGVSFRDAWIFLAAIEIETESGEAAARLLGQTILEFDTLRNPQLAGSYFLVAASFSLWRGDIREASRSAERGWQVVRTSEEWVLAARIAAMVAQVGAAQVAEAREQRQLAPLAAARSRAAEVIAAASDLVRAGAAPPLTGSRRIGDAYLATARAYQRRLEGDDDPALWARIAQMWTELSAPYDAALARWRQAEAELAAGGSRRSRTSATRSIELATRAAVKLNARPLLRELSQLAGRARIKLPDVAVDYLAAYQETIAPIPVDAGSAGLMVPETDGSELVRALVGVEPASDQSNTFGLSSREREVLALVALGKTNREIGEHLFISQKTVGVHVGNILSKLEVSGRVEAATVAIRLGLTPVS
jgi:DNA-binding CsgD family transcriptional regulator/tetratricopeptide (TPR) repeat protein